MSTRLQQSDLENRTKDHVGTNYLTLYSVMKGITLANCAYTLGLFFLESQFPHERIPLLVVGFCVIVLTYNSAFVGTLILAYPPNWKDTVLPFAVTIFEFLLFTALQKSATAPYWYFAFAVFAGSAALLLHHIISKIRDDQYDRKLKSVVSDYVACIKRARVSAATVCGAGIIVAVLANVIPFFSEKVWFYIFGCLAFVPILIAIIDQEIARQKIIFFTKQQSEIIYGRISTNTVAKKTEVEDGLDGNLIGGENFEAGRAASDHTVEDQTVDPQMVNVLAAEIISVLREKSPTSRIDKDGLTVALSSCLPKALQGK